MPTSEPEARTRVAGLLATAVGVDSATALTLLTTVTGNRSRSLLEIGTHLTRHPDFFDHPGSDFPLVMVKLAHALIGGGHGDRISAPQCAVCSQPRVDLNRRDAAGQRICGTCDAASRKGTCARCGRSDTRLTVRRAEGLICARCYNTDPEVVEPCGGCGRSRRPVGRADDGSPRCQLCYGRPFRTCSSCGRSRPANAITQQGPVCSACYRAPPRPCGICGQHRAIAKRGRDGLPDACYKCYQSHQQSECATCGRTRPCQRIGSGQPICQSCRPRPPRACFRCARPRPVQAEWPAGPVCVGCYEYIRRHPSACTTCHNIRPLIGADPAGEPTCGPCAGVDRTYTCRTCATSGEIHRDQQCFRCVLNERLADLLAGPDGTITPALQPVYAALTDADNPASLVTWVSRSRSARLLRQLVTAGSPLSHELLDAQPQTLPLHYIRELLVATDVLPQRDEHLERLEPWLDELLTGRPARIAQMVKQFGHWSVLRRARRSTQPAGGYRRGSADHARTMMTIALELLTWLDTRSVSLADLTQADLDLWLDEGKTTRRNVRYFLKWARRHRLCQELNVPMPRRADPTPSMSESDRTQQLHRCITDESIPLDLRAAAILVMLYGLLLSRVLRFTADDIIQRDRHVFLQVEGHELLLPPRVADLVLRQTNQRQIRSTLRRMADDLRWMFPGQSPSRPAHDGAFASRLNRAGLAGLAGRNAARFVLAAELPAGVLADLTGLHINTAIRWTNAVKRDWSKFVTLPHPPGAVHDPPKSPNSSRGN